MTQAEMAIDKVMVSVIHVTFSNFCQLPLSDIFPKVKWETVTKMMSDQMKSTTLNKITDFCGSKHYWTL